MVRELVLTLLLTVLPLGVHVKADDSLFDASAPVVYGRGEVGVTVYVVQAVVDSLVDSVGFVPAGEDLWFGAVAITPRDTLENFCTPYDTWPIILRRQWHRADVTRDGQVDISDVVWEIDYFLTGEE